MSAFVVPVPRIVVERVGEDTDPFTVPTLRPLIDEAAERAAVVPTGNWRLLKEAEILDPEGKWVYTLGEKAGIYAYRIEVEPVPHDVPA